MLKYPKAKWDPLGTQTEAKMKAHDILCFHTMVGSLAGTSGMFHKNGYGGTESHMGLGEKGEAEQWQDIMYSADANLDGWDRVVSIETADYGGSFGKWNTNNADNVPPWNEAQLDWLVDFTVWFCRKETHANCPATWACHKYGVPCELIPDTKQGRRGIGYHKQGCDPWRVDDGEKWSSAYGKGCPGKNRISQLINIVIPRAKKILAGGSTTEPEELDMDAATFKKLSTESLVAYFKLLYGPKGTAYAWHNQVMNTVNAFRNEERLRYARYEAIHKATMTALSAQSKLLQDQLAAFAGKETSQDATVTAQLKAMQDSIAEIDRQIDEANASLAKLEEEGLPEIELPAVPAPPTAEQVISANLAEHLK